MDIITQLKDIAKTLPSKTPDAPYSLARSSKKFLAEFNGVVVAVGLSVTQYKNSIDQRVKAFVNDGSSHNIIKIINREGMDLLISFLQATDVIEAVEYSIYNKPVDVSNNYIVLPDLLHNSDVPSISQQIKAHGMWLTELSNYDPQTMTHYYDNGIKKITNVEGMTFSHLVHCLNTSGLAASVCAGLGLLPITPHALEDATNQKFIVQNTENMNVKKINLPEDRNIIIWLNLSSIPFANSGLPQLQLIID